MAFALRLVGFAILIGLSGSCYTVQQAFRFNNLFNSRQKIETVLKSEVYSKKIRKKLVFSRKILAYAKTQGVHTKGAYQYYIHTSSDSVSYSVQAAKRDRLEFKTWWFPIVGRVPYLGYFDKEQRDQKAVDLARDFDVHVGQVGAFSSLGWFEDPIYTSMLKRSDASLAHLLFHELVHRTFWSKGSTRFNENLAEFGAKILTESWLTDLGMTDVLAKYQQYRADRALLRTWLKDLRSALRKLYRDRSLSLDQTLANKAKIIETFQTEMMPNFENPAFVKHVKKNWNNASLLGASLYTPNTSRFAAAYRCIGSPKIGEFLAAIEQAEQKIDEVFEAMDSLCQG